jgi:ABC-type sugar transport system permease subunit
MRMPRVYASSMLICGMKPARLLPFLLLAPALLIIGIVQLYPAFYSIQLSFNRVAGGNLTPVGVRNYQLVFASSDFGESLWHTAFFLFGYIVLTMLAGLGIALLLNRKLRFRSGFVTLLFIPWVLSDVIVGLVFKLFVDPDTGIFAPLLAQPFFGLDGSALLTKVPAYLSSGIPFPPAPALIYVIVAASWKALPFITLLILAALQTVPREVIESASIDGANSWQTFKGIVFPLVLPSVVVALFNLILGGMNGVGMVFSLTGGGPGSATEVLSYLLYQIGFGQLDFGRAAALSVFIAVINLVLIVLALRVSRQGAERYA